MHVLVELAGQADTAPFGQGLGHLLFVKLTDFHMLLAGIHTGDERLAHLLQELGDENPLHFGADLGQVLALDLRVLGLILQSIERGQARSPHGAGRHSGYVARHSRLLDDLQLGLEGPRRLDGLQDGDQIPGGDADGVQGLDYLADVYPLR